MARTRFRRWGWLLIVAVLSAGILVANGAGRGPGHVAEAANDPTDDAVTVTGVGAADGVPDTLTVDFSVSVRRSTVQSALDAQSRYTRRVLSALHDAGVADKQVRTTDLELFRFRNRHTHTSGYFASESVEARLTPLTHAGRTIAAVAASSSHVDVGQLRFDIANDTDLVKQARDNAWADAKARAEQYATLSGRSLGRVEHVTETVRTVPVEDFFGGAAAGSVGTGTPSVPLRGGQQTLTVRVNVVWALT
ncbi:MAG: uncharacterized protein QOJ03_1727 [Frankiaceae bacterium]|jgi:uncharacterized protein YggE|nr:uncharacterized protein [Frankiaceae bacterium]